MSTFHHENRCINLSKQVIHSRLQITLSVDFSLVIIHCSPFVQNYQRAKGTDCCVASHLVLLAFFVHIFIISYCLFSSFTSSLFRTACFLRSHLHSFVLLALVIHTIHDLVVVLFCHSHMLLAFFVMYSFVS